MNIAYSAEAIEDLARLREFVAIKNSKAAQKIAQQLLKSIQQLKEFPLIGKTVDASPDPEKVRDLIAANYTVRYLIVKNTVYILRVWHQREDK